VIPGIYQVRGFDLSDITFVCGKTGWIVFDPLVSAGDRRRRGRFLAGQFLGSTAGPFLRPNADPAWESRYRR
jgi:hypothetical protein